MNFSSWIKQLVASKEPSAYTVVEPNAVDVARYSEGWKDESVPLKQWRGVEKELAVMRQTKTFPPSTTAAVDAIKETGLKNPSLLEVGCSSGYFSQIFQMAGLRLYYEGCDYSPDFIGFAREKFPKMPFKVCDATALPYKDRSFDIVMSGSCLLHIPKYARAIQESARVAKHFVLFHKTPVLHLHPTIYTLKRVYDVEVLEIQFREKELLELFDQSGLATIRATSFATMSIPGIEEPIVYKDYLCRKSP